VTQCREPHLASSRSTAWFRRLSYVTLHLGYMICVPWRRRLECLAADFKQNNDIEVETDTKLRH